MCSGPAVIYHPASCYAGLFFAFFMAHSMPFFMQEHCTVHAEEAAQFCHICTLLANWISGHKVFPKVILRKEKA
jgi:hypothetical protein